MIPMHNLKFILILIYLLNAIIAGTAQNLTQSNKNNNNNTQLIYNRYNNKTTKILNTLNLVQHNYSDSNSNSFIDETLSNNISTFNKNLQVSKNIENRHITKPQLTIPKTNQKNIVQLDPHKNKEDLQNSASEENNEKEKSAQVNLHTNNSINLADSSYESSESGLTSHELLLKTSANIKESFVITSKNNMVYIQEKQYDPVHHKHHHNHYLNNPIKENYPIDDLTDDFYFKETNDIKKNRNIRHAQHGGYHPDNYNPGQKNNFFKELKKWKDKPVTFGTNYTKDPTFSIHKFYPHTMVADSINTVPSYAYNLQLGIFCSFEVACDWTWNNDSGCRVTTPAQLSDINIAPRFDADNNTIGNFLSLYITQNTRELLITSPKLTAPSSEQCSLELYLHQANMNASVIKVVGEIVDSTRTQWIVHEMLGNSYRMWRKHTFKIGRISQEFKLILEIIPPHFSPAHIAIDNIRLVDCYPEPAKRNMCVPHQFRCATTNVCVNVTQVCDINHDCKNGEDELQDCDKIPFGGRCDFEDGWCGWQNDPSKQIRWIRSRGATAFNRTGPSMDHTYHNTSGHYLLVNMAEYIDIASFAATASISSGIFNPPPTVHSNESSTYHNSCSVRFYYHQYGVHKSGLALMLIELKPNDNVSTEIWWSFADKEDKWHKGVVILPNITYRYYLQFHAKKGLRFLSIVALDDISLSPECFGLNIPQSELRGYNYWSPPEFIEPKVKETHKDFINQTYYQITSCGVKGKDGPTPENCSNFYQETSLEGQIEVLNNKHFKGIQRWIVPSTGYYTIIAKGASGGKGSGGMGSSRGSIVKGIVELHKGEHVYMLIGQEGRSACVKSLGRPSNSSCQAFWNEDRNLTGVRGVLKAILRDGGGGGGGATYIFRFQRKNDKPVIEPLIVAAGGGGLGLGQFVDNNLHHGYGLTAKKPFNGHTITTDKTSGAGGGLYREPNTTFTITSGHALENGGLGGVPCYDSKDGAGSGGFGGGGGGCTNGGGGGGYSGGNSWTPKTTNGEGGTSYISNYTLEGHREVLPGQHSGSGMVVIIPAESEKCGCNYRCVALDEHRAQTACICPVPNWFLGQDNVTCLLTDMPADHNLLIGILILVIFFLAVGFGILCIMLYNRHQRRKSEISRRKMLSGAELQLNRLRMQSDNNVLLTEYNPNYEFGGQVYTLKDLQDIPRDQLRLVKALGQGAFGEVYQGFYKARQSDAVEMPVAVKTLPEMSTQQAEMDFLMEALIMSKFNHPNIVHFIGVCFDKHPRFIVLELLAGGDLKNFLRESRPKPERSSPLTMKDLVLISIDVAKGCKYMEEHRFIHRDIAARNCLLTTKGPGRVVKIADFGMSRDIYRSDYYRKGGKAMLPIKWMPPEAFLDGIFTSKTDIWSFGVLLWEIMSMGFMPYTGCSNRQVMQLVTSGGRLEPPSNCPGPIYGIMTQCWHPTPEQRPTFSVLLERLGYCIQDPDVISNPLPVFTKAPSAERDTTVMRPKNTDGTYLQVPNTADYLIPIPTTTSCNTTLYDGSAETLLDEDETDVIENNWETSFMMPQSKSTTPLLRNNVENEQINNTPVVENLINIDSSPPQQNSITNNSTTNNQTTNTTPTETESQKLIVNHAINNHNSLINNNVKPSQIVINNSTNTATPNNTPSEQPTLKSGISLDASNLLKQQNINKKPYANIQPSNDYRTQNGPYSIRSELLNAESEISC